LSIERETIIEIVEKSSTHFYGFFEYPTHL